MALNATFTANFSNFFDAVAKADIKLKEFGGGADKVGDRLDRMVTRFSGQKVIQEAQLMVKAIGGIEGIAGLTEKEMEQLGRTTNEAVEKMGKLGKQVPKDLQAVADATKGANTSAIDWMGTITKIGAAVGIAFSLDAVKGFIGSIFDAASAIKDLSDQWGVSTQAVQQWSAAAALSGVAAETVGKSIQFMSEKLTDASTDYDALLANIGLSGDKLRAMSDEDAWREVIGALGKVTDEAKRLDLGVGLLGSSFRKMTGAVGDDFLGLAAKQKFMTDETVKRLAEAEAKWKSYYANITIWGADFISRSLENISTLSDSWSTFFKWMGLTAKDAANLLQFKPTTLAPEFLKAQQATEALQGALQRASKGIGGVSDATDELNPKIKTTAQVLADAKTKEEGLTRAQKTRTDAQAEATREQEAYNKSLDDYKRSISALASDFAGDDLIAKAIQYEQALQESIPIQQMTRQEQAAINKVMLDAVEVYQAAGREAPAAMWDIIVATQDLNEATKAIGPSLEDWKKSWPKAADLPVPKLPGLDAKPPSAKGFETFEQSIESVTKAFAQLGDISGGALDEVTSDIATVVGAMNVAQKSATTFKSGLASIKTGNLKQGFAQTAAGAAGVVGRLPRGHEGNWQVAKHAERGGDWLLGRWAVGRRGGRRHRAD